MSWRARNSVVRNFWVRLASYVLVIVITVVNVWPAARSTAFVTGLAAVVLLWSFASLALALRARDPRVAEMRTLLVDTGFAAACAAVHSFAAWPTVVFTLPPLLTNLRAGGPRWFLVGLGGATALAIGTPPPPPPNPATTLLCVVFLLGTMGALSLTARQQGQIVRQRNRALAEALERQTVTSETLRTLLNQSQSDLTAVFDVIIRSAVQLCNGDVGSVYRYDGEMIHLVAHSDDKPSAVAALRAAFPTRVKRESLTSRVILTRGIVHVPDVLDDPEFGFHTVARAHRLPTPTAHISSAVFTRPPSAAFSLMRA